MKSTLTTSLNWKPELTATGLTLTSGLIDRELESKEGGVCPTKTSDVTIKDVSLTPDNTNAIACFNVSGEVIVDIDGGKEEKISMLGTLAVVGSDSKTFEYK